MQFKYKTDLICDFAEFYRIYDYRGLPARYAATLAVGLGVNSRIKKKYFGIKADIPESYIMALIFDLLNLVYSKEDVKTKLLVDEMSEKEIEEQDNGTESFDDIESFEKYRSMILKGEYNGKFNNS